MSPADRIGIEGIILGSRDRELRYSERLRLVAEMVIPILLGLVYVGILLLTAEP
jgi:hypothetical protein